MTPAQFAEDMRDQLQLRVQLETAIRDRLTWRGIAVESIHSLAAAYDRIAVLERQLQETRDELRRYTSRATDAAPKEQA
jgi:hypothetical protein